MEHESVSAYKYFLPVQEAQWLHIGIRLLIVNVRQGLTTKHNSNL